MTTYKMIIITNDDIQVKSGLTQGQALRMHIVFKQQGVQHHILTEAK